MQGSREGGNEGVQEEEMSSQFVAHVMNIITETDVVAEGKDASACLYCENNDCEDVKECRRTQSHLSTLEKCHKDAVAGLSLSRTMVVRFWGIVDCKTSL
jgi:hypothetical protein